MSDLFPGWYADPEVEDQVRWWNGIGWVDRVLPKGYSEVQIIPLAEPQSAPDTPPVAEPGKTEPDKTVTAKQADDDATLTHDVVVDLRSDDHEAELAGRSDDPVQPDDPDQASSEDRASRRDLPTAPIGEIYIAWDGLAYEGQPPEGWHLSSDDRWWAPGTGPDAEAESTSTIDPAATVIAPPKAKSESDTSAFSLPSTSYSRLEKLPSAHDAAGLDTKKSSWWKRRKR